MKIFLLFISLYLVIFTLAWPALPGEELKPYEGKIIRNIFITRRNVFDDKINQKTRFYYRWGNSLHFITRENVIRRELLFSEGDSLKVAQVVESQRNLRLKAFIGDVEFKVIPAGNDSIDFDITTTDLWTTKAEAYLDLAGGNYTAAIGATESNLFGTGKMIQLSAENGSDQNGLFLLYYDPRLIGSHLALNMSYSDYTYSKNFLYSLTRPQYSLEVPFGFKSLFSITRARPRLFYHGEEYFIYRQNKTIVSLAGAYTLGKSKRLSFIPGYDYEKQDFSEDKPDLPLNAYIPQDELMSYPSLGIRIATLKYGVEKYLDSAGNPEDMTYGAALKYRFGQSLDAFGADFIGYFQYAIAQFLCKPRDWLYIGGLDEVTWWGHNGRSERIRHISRASIYIKPAETHTLAIGGLTDFAWRQRNAYQVYLGGGNGLRGYSFYEFAGSKLAVGNIEYRFYTPLEILTVKIGAAAFFDIGNVWRQSDDIHLKELKSDIGLGLRFGLIKSSTSRVVNLDLARALSDSGFYITFSSLASFNLGFANIGE